LPNARLKNDFVDKELYLGIEVTFQSIDISEIDIPNQKRYTSTSKERTSCNGTNYQPIIDFIRRILPTEKKLLEQVVHFYKDVLQADEITM